MRRSGTSRAPLREALRLLGQRGLVEHLPRRGVRVARLSAREVSELFGLRDVLERFAVDLALGPGLPPDPLRLGVADRRHGAAQIAAWRRAHPGVPPGRRLSETVIVAVDERTAVVSTLSG
ncbi:MAG TPA: hypothetical protein VJT49_15520 [Amycolatopsis sp.]|uniref:hypothetical protein n=1 Tax=Amycolatopsis sp. TaxID=37632 RepID=UPI002B4730A8|nr:hypothetical protein [Amycolatopsis sp.]HKS46487.1 hypothetical protein [Amycolatopsis sp.]